MLDTRPKRPSQKGPWSTFSRPRMSKQATGTVYERYGRTMHPERTLALLVNSINSSPRNMGFLTY